jgi:hypothetical protein
VVGYANDGAAWKPRLANRLYFRDEKSSAAIKERGDHGLAARFRSLPSRDRDDVG